MIRLGVYAIVNTESGKVYIGSTVDFVNRQRQHRQALRRGDHHNEYLQRAWNKYSETAFKFGVLEYLDNSEELHLAEQFWMDMYREEGRELYNFGLAARHAMLGQRHTAETCQKMREAAQKHPASEEARRKMSIAATGVHPTEENRREMSRRMMGNTLALGLHPSEETRRKLGEALAKPYPAFVHKDTGEIIPAGVNLRALCVERGLHQGHMAGVKNGRRIHCQGWALVGGSYDPG